MNYTHGSLENEILKTIWMLEEIDESDVSVNDVQEVINRNSSGKRAYTTVKTVMDRLTVKSILVRYKVGKKFFYKATMSRNEMAMEAIKETAEQFFNGNYVEMMKFIENECSEFLVK